ncbi:MAG: cofactor-independent phosphoglycerate mutase [Actinobacteria bacterium]|nr:cofactor-independent phosphoglycerate mutase [Actinomycetota bacterium]
MKYLVLIPDGSADEHRPELGGRTPLQAANTPNFDRLARSGTIGLTSTIPEGFPPGSDVANLCVLGYDPHLYYTGRAPLEAASLGIDLASGDVAFRCNLVCVEDGLMRDFSAGHIDTVAAAELIDYLQQNLGGEDATFFPGLSYRHIMVSKGKALQALCTPPHDITGQPVDPNLPQGEESAWLRGLMQESTQLLAGHPINEKRKLEGKLPANMIWLWGQGTAPSMPTFKERYRLEGSVISAVDLVKGLGKYAGLEVIEVPGATGWLDTDYAAKARYALKELKNKDFVYVHVESPDEASHSGDSSAKVEAIERFDALLLGNLLEGLATSTHYRILILPDHATPLGIRTHTAEPVPFVCYDPAAASDRDQSFDEDSASSAALKFERGWDLMGWFLGLEKK